ncbi:MAG: DUF1844 domain-containing protein [Thermoanaerobaculia bacterium]
MSTDKKAPKELKVTDKRIFTADGEIKDEFKNEIHAAPAAAAAPAETPKAEPKPAETSKAERPERSAEDRATNPGTPFAHFLESLIMQAYMSLGMLRNPYSPQAKPEPAAARQMIDILTMLKEKTAGNLSIEEEDFLDAHLGELKLAYVQRTKNI